MAISKKKTIFTDQFLLESKMANKLYHNHVANLPIIDYHNHLPPNEIAENKKFKNLTEIWLKGDHYKWRAMRALGIDEKLITGNASDEDKFKAWAACMPQTIRNPLFHWSHLELKRPFGINEYLDEKSAGAIYKKCNTLLVQDKFSTQGILNNYKVELVGTTDDPCDDLADHKKIAKSGFKCKVLPTFRPDKALNIADKGAFIKYLHHLEKVSGTKVNSINTFLIALESRVNYFHQNGCRVSDHAFTQMPSQITLTTALEKEFVQFIQNKNSTPFSQPERFSGAILLSLSRMYCKKGWVQQFHLGPIRNNNSKLLARIGADSGTDSIGDYPQAVNLSNFLNALDQSDELAKTILYNNNPSDNEVFATMCGNFSDGKLKGKMQFGSGWWFLDQKEGMEKQINALSNMGVVSTFIGMLTDSRSFLSYSRHEYFRRIICNLFAQDMEKGLIPNDEKWIADVLKNICYYNAKEYFKIK
jgi:glucuronate isomerase